MPNILHTDPISSLPNAQKYQQMERKHHHGQRSVLAPSVTARHALEETRHGLIGTPNLHLEKGRLLAGASLVGALRL